MELLSIITWAIWRRCLGGFNDYRRSHVVAVMFLLCLPYAFISWVAYAICVVITSLFFLLGHHFEEKTIVIRYPLIGIVYPISKAVMGDKKFNSFIDGWTSLAELLLGAWFGLVYIVIYNLMRG